VAWEGNKSKHTEDLFRTSAHQNQEDMVSGNTKFEIIFSFFLSSSSGTVLSMCFHSCRIVQIAGACVET
jgi:uncharacterized membrane protein YoaK (UPF0700 family)